MPRTPGFLALTTGIKDIMNLAPQDINVWDWAWGLQHQGRFSGATPIMWSVLSHTGLVFELAMRDNGGQVNPVDQLALLLHDAPEAYLQDFPRPLKKLPEYGVYRDLEDEIMAVILTKFGLKFEDVNWDFVKKYDDQALWLEFQWFFPHVARDNPRFAPPQVYEMDATKIVFKLAKPAEYVEVLRHLAINMQEVTGIDKINEWFASPPHLSPYLVNPSKPEEKDDEIVDGDSVLSLGLDG